MCIVWINFFNFEICKNLKSKTFYITDKIWDILFKGFMYIWKKNVFYCWIRSIPQMSIRSSWLIALFKFCAFLLIFYLLVLAFIERGILKSPTINCDFSPVHLSIFVSCFLKFHCLEHGNSGLLCPLDELTSLLLWNRLPYPLLDAVFVFL